MSAPAVTPYDVCGPLPTGTTLLEASAGTGKTFTIAALATRIVAEGEAELSRLMLVTFSRAATAELRDRVRERLVSAYRKLQDPAVARADEHDTLVQLLATGDAAQVDERRQRLGVALSAFDAATIATTHGFCQQMLAGLGIAADTDHAATLVERLDDLVDEIVEELYLRRYGLSDDGEPLLDHGCARKVVAAAVTDPFSTLAPADAATGTAAQHRYGIGDVARREVDRRKRMRHLFDYNDLLLRLDQALTDPVTGPVACERIRARYRYVLVDEFQDTDPVQWDILRTAFHGHTHLVLIGDPKQAIYAFRGADVFAYLRAAGEATTQHTLARNWRSDADLLAALDGLYGGAALGDERIVVRPVEAEHPQRRLSGAPVAAPLRMRMVPRSRFGVADAAYPSVGEARGLVAADVAGDIVTLLTSGATLTLDGGTRPARPGDIAVLVRTHDQAEMVRTALVAAGVPAVLTGMKSVFLSPSAREWLVLLRALEEPHRSGLARAAALTSFAGWDAARLATSADDEIDEFALTLREWRDALVDRGVAALLEVVTTSQNLTERLLAHPDGERRLTDLRHVGQTLHAAARSSGLGPAALVEWLRRQIADAEHDQTEERSRRLESDADAVQVATIYISKGLQFPVVYAPYLWDRWVESTPDPASFHTDDGERVLYVGGKEGPGYDDCRARHAAEAAGEELRLLYVALTRAQCQVVTWWAPTKSNTSPSALHRLLFSDWVEGEQPPATATVPPDGRARRRLREWAEAAGSCVSLEEAVDSRDAVWSPPAPPVTDLGAARWERTLDTAWRRTSYTSLTAEAQHVGSMAAGVGSEPESDERRDEPAVAPAPAVVSEADEQRLRAVPSPMADLPSGTAFGTVVHSVLEAVETPAHDLRAELLARCDHVVRDRMTTTLEPASLADALVPVMQTPLGALAGERSLAEVPTSDRLAELEFEMPLVGGDRPHAGTATLGAVADLLDRHLGPDDALAAYPDMLRDPRLGGQVLRGYLTGSIDVVLRVRAAAGTPRYLVVDYKTNWLGELGPSGALPLTAWDYRPAVLAVAMVHAHYPLQALLYAVALHRYLRWRQPAYDPGVHLGGVLYLFLRGMCGPSSPTVHGAPTGVFSWLPPPQLVVDLSALLDTGVSS